MIEYLSKLDQSIFLTINGAHNTFFDYIMWWASGKLTWLPLYLFLIWLLYKKAGKAVWIYLIALFLLILMSDQVSVFIKNLTERFRPCHNEELKGMVHLLKNKCGGKYGFVSSHAANTFALATFIILTLRKQYLVILMLSYAILVSYSRVYLGNHYPFDVLGGALLGIICGFFIYYITNIAYIRFKPKSHAHH